MSKTDKKVSTGEQKPSLIGGVIRSHIHSYSRYNGFKKCTICGHEVRFKIIDFL